MPLTTSTLNCCRARVGVVACALALCTGHAHFMIPSTEQFAICADDYSQVPARSLCLSSFRGAPTECPMQLVPMQCMCIALSPQRLLPQRHQALSAAVRL